MAKRESGDIQEKKRVRILLTNDDGFEAPGLLMLRDALSEIGDIVTVAPTIEKSASGHSLTLTRPLRFIEVEKDFYKLDDGTPSDCVFLALKKIYGEGERPDLLVSGINRGANMGEDITYSGTVAAAMEGVLQGISSIAVSQVCERDCSELDAGDYSNAVDATVTLVKKILEDGFPLEGRRLLNINVPPPSHGKYRGFRITHAGHRAYGNDAQVHYNPRGVEYYWIGLPLMQWSANPKKESRKSDFEAVKEGYVSITPVQLDMTSYEDIPTLGKWL